MRVTVIGGGPAGLYFAILMKKAAPEHAIRVIERNPADATFGWGVVFSEETLGALRDADYESYVQITDSFARWNTIDIRYRETIIRSRGHTFSGISRKTLLGILQRRALELGVDLRFEEEVADPDTLAESDLVVAADGVNSVVRARHSAELGASSAPIGSKFVWFGTDRIFDAFTFIFRETKHGLFQAHAYPFDASSSTFIVECPEATWRNAGLEEMTEQQSIEFCEELFRADLAGHRLLSNRSLWMSFMEVRAASWHLGNTVLLGDAIHTAHFSIGSGTKLAMEDAITLSSALMRHPELERALVDYELERQPIVERFQVLADQSADYFTRVQSYFDFDPIQFAFNLVTRSGRISYANLTIRDPQFIRVLDSWFACCARQEHSNGALQIAPPPMFAPLRIGSTTLRNRVIHAPSGEDACPDGRPSDSDRDRLTHAAQAGPALVLTGLVAVSPDARVSPSSPTIHGESQQQAWAQIVDAVHGEGALIALQLGHAGRRGATRPRCDGADLPLREHGWPLISASPLPYTAASATPRAAEPQQMQLVCEQHAAAAERALQAGFDALELNFAQGYLLSSFLSPLSNRRDDEYGATLAGRLRFPLQVLDAVCAVWPQDRLLIVRATVSDWAPGGIMLQEAVQIVRALCARRCDCLHVSAGQTIAEDRPDYRRAFLTSLSDRIRTECRVPTLVAGYLTTVDEVNTILGAGRADLCMLEQPMVDPMEVAA